MKAMTRHRYGSAEVLDLREVPAPVAGDGQVLVRVRAAGMGPNVWHELTGVPYLARLGFGVRRPKSPLLRCDIAGTVESVGRDVTGFRPGDAVYGVSDGGLAELAVALADELAPKPANVTFEEAAAVPVSACAALHGLRDEGRICAGQQVLIIGASGGVGSFAVQLASAFGAEVTGVCRAGKAEFVRGLGADHVIDYTRDELTGRPERYDLVLDAAGRRRINRLRRLLAPGGALVVVGGEGGGRWTGGFERQVVGSIVFSLVMRQRVRSLISQETQSDLLELNELIESGQLLPAVTRTLPFERAAEALRDADEGHGLGKVVLTVGSPSDA
jgi:NADPH:quinone reductase-like Zn-dependent oxidoreductase